MSEQYSPERRTALVLTGTGADGAYHAGVLRALHEAGVKIDIVAGRGIGVVSAVYAAVDGAARLWDDNGLWQSRAVPSIYRWRWPFRITLILLAAIGGVLAAPLLVLAVALIVYPLGLLLGMAGLEAGAALVAQYARLVASAFAPAALPTWLPRLVFVLVAATLVMLLFGGLAAWARAQVRRRSRGPIVWALLATPLDGANAIRHFTKGLWDLLQGAALKTVPEVELSQRYSELLSDNMGQPGFRELLVAVHDIDARRDLIFGLVREPFRRALFPPPGAAGLRRAEAFDLAGLARRHLVDVMRAALSVPAVTEAPLVRFSPDSYWRGEAHRLIDRASCLGRLVEEAAAAGAEQLILVSASAELPGPHELRRPQIDPFGRVNEQVAALEAASLRDAVRQVQHRFRAVYQIRPVHNPVGALDLAGAYDERSDRHHPLGELIELGYQDAYQQFIEPVVAASGERIT